MSWLLKTCSDSDAFELVPRRRTRLPLPVAREWLLAGGFREVVDAGVVLIVERECTVNIYPSGRVLLRTNDQAQAEALAAELGELLDAPNNLNTGRR